MNWTCANCSYMNDGPICTKCQTLPINPVQPVQDRAEDLLDTWRKHSYVMFPQQRRIYEQLAKMLSGDTLEAGCGNGAGSAVIERSLTIREVRARDFRATDSLQSNVKFAKCLYHWIDFQVWDICKPYGLVYDAVVCVECLEHVADPQAAICNLLAAARQEVWISTPNGAGKPRPPSNPFHVQEFSVYEMRDLLAATGSVLTIDVLNWENFERLDWDTKVDPLVYRIQKRQYE